MKKKEARCWKRMRAPEYCSLFYDCFINSNGTHKLARAQPQIRRTRARQVGDDRIIVYQSVDWTMLGENFDEEKRQTKKKRIDDDGEEEEEKAI